MTITSPATLEVGFRSYASEGQAHTHAFFQVVLPSRGVLDIEIAGRGGRVDHTCAAFIGPGERHAFAAATGDENRFLVLDFASADSFPHSVLNGLVERRFLTLSPAAHHLIGYAEQHVASDAVLHRDESRRRLMWLELLLEALCESPPPSRSRAATTLSRAKAFIERSFDRPLDASDIARAAGISPSRLYELFQKHVGATPRQYLAQTRLRYALELLKSSRLSIAEIAASTGHADQSTLTRHMRSALGVTPAAHRRALAVNHATTGERARSAGESVKKR